MNTGYPISTILHYCNSFVSTPKEKMLYREQFAGVYVSDGVAFATNLAQIIVWKTDSQWKDTFIAAGEGVKDKDYKTPNWQGYLPSKEDVLHTVELENGNGLKRMFTHWKKIFAMHAKGARQGKLERGVVYIYPNKNGLFSYSEIPNVWQMRARLCDTDSQEIMSKAVLAFNPNYFINICNVLENMNPYKLTIKLTSKGLYMETEEQMIRWYCCNVKTPQEVSIDTEW